MTATKVSKKKKTALDGLPKFISKSEMAEVLRCSVDAITDWTQSGHFPTPILYPGPNRHISLWRLDHFQAFLSDREWPDDAFASGVGAGL